MQNTISVNDWLQTIETEYLASFIKDGGASVKFAVAPDGLRAGFGDVVEKRCRELDYAVVRLDAAETKFHMPQDIFFGMANQVDWRYLARRLIVRIAGEIGYQTENVDLGESGNIFKAIGEGNGIEARTLLVNMGPEFQDRIFKNQKMSKDFRVAMSHLCQRENVAESGEYSAQPLLDWLKGHNNRISNVRQFRVASGINRNTARYFIESALYWFQFVGHTGTVILLDGSRVTLSRNPQDGRRYYTKAMAMDHYEMLRELVDGTDRLTGSLIILATNEDFLEQSANSRGFGIYPALMTRVMDDVRDKNLVNPVASLIRLS